MVLSSPTQGKPLAKARVKWLKRTKYYLSVPSIIFLLKWIVGSSSLKEQNGGLYTTQSLKKQINLELQWRKPKHCTFNAVLTLDNILLVSQQMEIILLPIYCDT